MPNHPTVSFTVENERPLTCRVSMWGHRVEFGIDGESEEELSLMIADAMREIEFCALKDMILSE